MKQFIIFAAFCGLMLTGCGQATQKGNKSQSPTDSIAAVIQSNICQPEGVKALLHYHRRYDAQQVQAWLAQIPVELKDQAIADLTLYYEVMEKTEKGKRYIDLVLQTPEGTEKKLSDYVSQHTYTLLDFWVSGEGQERVQSQLRQLYRQYHAKGLEVVGVSLDTDATQWKKTIQELQLEWPQLTDLKGTQGVAYRLYTSISAATSFLIDRQGNIVSKFLSIEELEAKLKELL